MKHTYIFLLCIPLLPVTHFTYSYTDQDFNNKLNTLQQSIDILVAQSDLDPEVAQDITDKINDINQYAQENIQQDIKEIRVAAGLSSLLESADKMTKAMNIVTYSNLIEGFKYSARANTIHKLLIGAYPGKFKDQPYYTDPYTESVGFTINDYFFNILFTALLKIVAPTSFGSALSLNTDSPIKPWVTRITAALTAHYAWLLQKKLIIDQQQKQS
jgi:hypothetical protein